MEITFTGKRALVTGATKGIGRDIALQLSKCGAEVTAIGRNTEQCYAAMKKECPSIKILKLDISKWDETKEKLAEAGPFDLLVNNAGMGWMKPITEITEKDVDDVLGVNTKALINITQIVVKDLLARKVPGAIVNLSSQASMAGLMNHTVYCASKGAVDAFTRAAALELGPHNIRVNCVNPTVIMTDMGRLGWSDPKVAEPMIQKIPLRRIADKNIKVVSNVSRVVVENLLARKVPGSVVTVLSPASKAGLVWQVIYSATKAAVDGFTRAAALNCGPNKIRFNSVNPSVMAELSKKVWSDPIQTFTGSMVGEAPLRRFGEGDDSDVVNAVIFLLNDKTGLINGSSLTADGGFSASQNKLSAFKSKMTYLQVFLLQPDCFS